VVDKEVVVVVVILEVVDVVDVGEEVDVKVVLEDDVELVVVVVVVVAVLDHAKVAVENISAP
jgi:hypothetical protein